MIKTILVILLAYTVTVPAIHPLKVYSRKGPAEVAYIEVIFAPVIVPMSIIVLGFFSLGNCAIGCK